MKKTVCSVFIAFLLLLSAISGYAEESVPFSLEKPLVAGSSSVGLRLEDHSWSDLRMNAFSGEEQLGTKAEITDGSTGGSRVVIRLSRPVREGEEIRIFLTASSGESSPVEASACYSVVSRFGSKFQRLRARADDMWPVLQGIWLKAYLDGAVYGRVTFDDLPFVLFPDEAPEIQVEEDGETARIWISEPLPDGWNISLASGIPVDLTPCEWDESYGAWVGSSGFDSVYLTSDAGADRIGVTVVYERSNQFLASWPIAEWVEEGTEEPMAFNCYGFGTARRFDGGMYAIVKPGAAWYLEYTPDHGISTFTDLFTECVYTPEGRLISGESPDGFVFPAVIW